MAASPSISVLVRFRRVVILGVHLTLVPLGYALAYGLRFDGAVPSRYAELFWHTLPVLVVLRVGAFAGFGLLRGWWRHVSMFDLKALLKATTLSSLAFVAYLIFFRPPPGVPRSVLLMDWGIALMLFGGIRFGVRWLREGGGGRSWGIGGKRSIVVGAGNAGAHLVRQVMDQPDIGIQPVGFVDDDRHKSDLQIHGVPVLGTTRDLARLVRELDVSMLVLAIPTATREERRRIAERCAGLDVELKVMPSLHELIDGRARLTELRRVEVEDLLGRPTVTLDLKRVEEDLAGHVVLVTGAAGSIGFELARQIAGYRPSRLVLLEQAESPLYLAHLALRTSSPRGLEIVPVVGSVTDPRTMEELFARHRPEYVFHAAAYKHVPLMQGHVVEAVRNNVFGTLRVAETAARYGVGKFVLISTDKAVRPSSVMGATKRIAERIVLDMPSLRRSHTDFRAVRFGNVLDSAGSVVPVFRRQIASGGPVTVTHPDVTRYFMTITEAVQLVLEAAALPEAANRISMLEMGEPVRILDMAENLVRLSGLEPYEQIPIVFTGLRPGEKLHEELMSEVEKTVPTQIERIRIVQSAEVYGPAVAEAMRRLEGAALRRASDELVMAILSLVPEAVGPLRDMHRQAVGRRAVRPARFGSGRMLAADGHAAHG